MKRKCLAVGIILLFVGTCIIPAIAQDTEKPLPTSRGNWLYVGGSGPGNYTKIQDAINASSPSDTVYVYNGTYHEEVIINVISLKLIGEGRDNTVIDSRPISTAVSIQQSFVVIQGFTIIAADNFIYGNGILVSGGLEKIKIYNNNLSITPRGVNINGYNNYDVIENNVFYSNFYGIYLDNYNKNGYSVIRNNIFVDNAIGLVLFGLYNEIFNNTYLNCRLHGIEQVGGGDSTFRDNIFIGNDVGLRVREGNNIIGNDFENNGIGISFFHASSTVINQNNFIKNRRDATFSIESRSQGNTWDGNYWGRPRILPKPLLHIGIYWIIEPSYYKPGLPLFYPWLAFDWHPALKPYDIGV